MGTKADDALALVGLSLKQARAPDLGWAYTAGERTAIVAGCFELYLIAAEAEPEHAQQGRRRAAPPSEEPGIALLDQAARLGLQTRGARLPRATLSRLGRRPSGRAEGA